MRRILQNLRRKVANADGDLNHPKLLYAKGFLFLLAGILSAAALVVEAPTLRVGLLLVLTVWCFARAYYFAFYVIEHYVDPGWRFSGLWSFFLYLLDKRAKNKPPGQPR